MTPTNVYDEALRELPDEASVALASAVTAVASGNADTAAALLRATADELDGGGDDE